jgi:hypothetical protein
MTKRFTPTFFIASLNVIVFAVINGFQLVIQTPLNYVNKWIMPGVDYRDFYQASLQVSQGGSPYFIERYVTPPLFALVNLLFTRMGFETARALFMLLIPFMVLFSYLLVSRVLMRSDLKENDWITFSGILVILFSYPLYFLFERGNIDGVVLIFMCLGLYLMPEEPRLGGLLLASAIHFKLYPILLLIPLLLSRRWKPFLWVCAWMLILMVVTIPYWHDFGTLLSRRSNSFQLFENGSLVNTFLFIGMSISNFFGKDELLWAYAPLYSVTLYGLFMAILFIADYKLSSNASSKQFLVNALLYFPFMVALPKSVYHYEFVVLIPLLPVLDYLWKRTVLPSERIIIWIIVIGVALSQWQSVALYTLTNNMIAYYIPGFGLLLVMTGISAYKFMQLKQSIQKPIPENQSGLESEGIRKSDLDHEVVGIL